MPVGVVGHPIAHSLVAGVLERGVRARGTQRRLPRVRRAPGGLRDVRRRDRGGRARGLNVTMPHKRAAFEAATDRSAEAERTGAVNVLVFDDDRVIGANTDVHGFSRAVEDLDVDPDGAKRLVVGAGGAASAALLGLLGAGAVVTLVNRTRERADALSRAFDEGVRVIDWAELEAGAADADMLVHAASVGMDGSTSAIDPSVLESAARGRLRAVLDVVYAPKETALVHAARTAGLRAEDGMSMLVHQAEEAYRLFWDAPPPTGVMREAALRAAGRAPIR